MLAQWFIAALAVLASPALSTPVPAPAPDASPEAYAAEHAELVARSGGGINDYSCKSSPGKDPVIFLHGLTAPSVVNWLWHGTAVALDGYCIYTPQIGTKNGFLFGFKSMRESSKEVAAIVDKVLASTGATKVNLVGHSMGTTVSAYYMKFLGGKDKVNHFVGFGANYKGTSLYGVNQLVKKIPGMSDVLRAICESCDEFLSPSQFLKDLNEGGVTVPGPDYTTIASHLDQYVLPHTSGLLYEPGVTNIVIQKQCGFIIDLAGHLSQAIDPNVTSWIFWALRGKNGRIPGCVPFAIPFKRDSEYSALEA